VHMMSPISGSTESSIQTDTIFHHFTAIQANKSGRASAHFSGRRSMCRGSACAQFEGATQLFIGPPLTLSSNVSPYD
jgi:hypothetical protein